LWRSFVIAFDVSDSAVVADAKCGVVVEDVIANED